MVNEWTRDDLPRIGAPDPAQDSVVEGVLDAVLHWLNKHHPKPHGSVAVMLEDIHRVQLDRDRWRRAHEIVEQERDQARDERDQYRRSGDEWKECHADAVRERDEWKARAEAAEARTAPAVTREDVRGVIDHWIVQGGNHEALLDDLWRWVSGADPAVHVVRESQLPDVENKGDGGWDSGGQWYPSYATTEIIRENIARSARNLVNDLAVARAIEAGQAVDPLLDKAQEFAALADWELTDREAGLLHTVARHVLGQEANNDGS